MYDRILDQVQAVRRDVLEPTLAVACEIAREGREGRRVGTLFTVGDSDAVLGRSRALILDPLIGHSEDARSITDSNMRGTLKELAQLDGAFIINDDGVVVSACRYLDAPASEVDLPLGLGSRHVAAASISQNTNAVVVVVSESGIVRVFHRGQMLAEMTPDLVQ